MSPTYPTRDWYAHPLYYDVVFDADTPAEADFLEGAARRFGRSGGRRVLEPACGTGRLVRALARRGWWAAGFDASPSMLAYARTELHSAGLPARLFQARLEEFAARAHFDLVHCLLGSFRYLGDGRDARAHLRAVAGALRPGGLYVLGLHLADLGAPSPTRERWVGERGGLRVGEGAPRSARCRPST